MKIVTPAGGPVRVFPLETKRRPHSPAMTEWMHGSNLARNRAKGRNKVHVAKNMERRKLTADDLRVRPRFGAAS